MIAGSATSPTPPRPHPTPVRSPMGPPPPPRPLSDPVIESLPRRIRLTNLDLATKSTRLANILLDSRDIANRGRQISWTLGRSLEADIIVEDVLISRRHASIRADPNGWTITDHKSANGVFVNDAKISPNKPFVISDGSTVSLGPTSICRYAWKVSVMPETSGEETDAQRAETCDNDGETILAVVEDAVWTAETAAQENASACDGESVHVSVEKPLKEEASVKAIGNLRTKFSEELSCTICNEIFISPMTMPCGHIFCKFCLAQWKKQCQGRQYDCPNCRQKVGRDKVTPNLYLENLITSFLEELGPDLKEQRKKAIKERKDREEEAQMAEERKRLEASNKRKRVANARSRNLRGIEAFLIGYRGSNPEEEHVDELEAEEELVVSVEEIQPLAGSSSTTGESARYNLRGMSRVALDEPIVISSDSSSSSSSSSSSDDGDLDIDGIGVNGPRRHSSNISHDISFSADLQSDSSVNEELERD